MSEDVANLLTDLDRETLPCGEPRWEARLDKARSKLTRAGCLKADSPRGVWELAGPGLERLRAAGLPAPPPPATSRGPNRGAGRMSTEHDTRWISAEDTIQVKTLRDFVFCRPCTTMRSATS